METELNEWMETLKQVLAKSFNIKQIILFGSHAYGVSDADSDIDLCVVTDLGNQRKIEVIRAIRRELITFITAPLDILVYSEKEFMDRSRLKSTLEHKIMIDGVHIYG